MRADNMRADGAAGGGRSESDGVCVCVIRRLKSRQSDADGKKLRGPEYNVFLIWTKLIFAV